MIAKMCAKFNSFNFHGCALKSKVSLVEEEATKNSSPTGEERQSNRLHVAQLSDGRLIIADHVIFLVEVVGHFAGGTLAIQQGDCTDGRGEENNHKKNSQHNVASLSNIQNHEGL